MQFWNSPAKSKASLAGTGWTSRSAWLGTHLKYLWIVCLWLALLKQKNLFADNGKSRQSCCQAAVAGPGSGLSVGPVRGEEMMSWQRLGAR